MVSGDHHVCCVRVQPHACTRCEGQFDLTLRAPTFVHAVKYFVMRVVSGDPHVRCMCVLPDECTQCDTVTVTQVNLS